MKATLKRLDTPKYSRNGDVRFQRVYFELEDGSWAATDLVPTYRNYKRWEPILQSGVGTVIGGVGLKTPDKINADSEVYITQPTLNAKPRTGTLYPEYKPEPKMEVFGKMAFCAQIKGGCGKFTYKELDEPTEGLNCECGQPLVFMNRERTKQKNGN